MSTLQMIVSTGMKLDCTIDAIREVLDGPGWMYLANKWEYGQWTFLMFHIENMTICHAVRGKCDAHARDFPPLNRYKNYTGEFIRALRFVPEHMLPIDQKWLSICVAEAILGREFPLWLTIVGAAGRWGCNTDSAYKKMFHDYPEIPPYSHKIKGMRGYTILSLYGIDPHVS